jgi:hypothetical protein
MESGLDEATWRAISTDDFSVLADAVMALGVPVPTRTELLKAISAHLPFSTGGAATSAAIAGDVLALLVRDSLGQETEA